MGPACALLLDKKIDFEITHLVDEFLRSIAKEDFPTPKISREFWIDADKFPKITSVGTDCGFFLTYDNKLREMEEDDILELEMALDFHTQARIAIVAGSNQAGAHNVLAELILEIAKLTGGLIDFGYDIKKYNLGEQKEFEGLIYEITHHYGQSINHFVDATYFEAWLINNQKNIRMVK